MGIIRANKTTGKFFIASKYYVEDETLSWKAKGIMSYLFSKPDDWHIYQTQLEKVSTDGKASVRAAINELLENGYMTRKNRRKSNGDFDGYDYTLHEYPVNDGVRKMEDVKMEDAKMVFAKSDTTNNDFTNNDLTKNDNNSVRIPYKEIIDYLNEKAGKRYSYKSKETKDFIKARYKEDRTLEDFKTVIDTKVSHWKGSDEWEVYLRPKTLFSKKFETYLNEVPNNKNTSENSFFDQLMNEEG